MRQEAYFYAMIRFHSINGVLTKAGEASLLVSDLSILRGYGVFDFFLVRNGKPLFFDDYLSRFFRSAALMDLEMPVSRPALEERILEVTEANQLRNGAIRLLLTGGYSEDGITPQSPNLLVLAHEPHPDNVAFYESGVKLLPQQFQREFPEAKTINYANGLRIRKQLREAHAYEPLYHNGQEVLESLRSNVFFVFDGPVLATPSKDILQGITRKQVSAMGRNFLPVEERPIALGEVRNAKEAFLTGSSRAILPIVQIGDIRIGDGKVGPVTQKLMKSWEDHVEAWLSQPGKSG